MAQEDSFWRAGGFTGYAQVALTALALISGLLAFGSWRYQETAKRNSEIAIQLLKDVNQYVYCLEEARESLYLLEHQTLDRELAKKIGDEGATRLKTCAPAQQTVRIDEAVVAAVFGLKIANTLQEIRLQDGLVASSHQYLLFISSDEELWAKRNAEQVAASATRAGLRIFVKDTTETKPFAGDDIIAHNLKVLRSNLEIHLGPYLRMN